MKHVKAEEIKTKIKKEFNLWAEGKYIDFWTINHILAGAVIAGVSVISSVPFWTIVIVLFSLTIVWEIYETIKNIRETIENKILDVIVAMVGFAIIYIVMNVQILNNVILVLIITLLFTILNILGYLNYRKTR